MPKKQERIDPNIVLGSMIYTIPFMPNGGTFMLNYRSIGLPSDAKIALKKIHILGEAMEARVVCSDSYIGRTHFTLPVGQFENIGVLIQPCTEVYIQITGALNVVLYLDVMWEKKRDYAL